MSPTELFYPEGLLYTLVSGFKSHLWGALERDDDTRHYRDFIHQRLHQHSEGAAHLHARACVVNSRVY